MSMSCLGFYSIILHNSSNQREPEHYNIQWQIDWSHYIVLSVRRCLWLLITSSSYNPLQRPVSAFIHVHPSFAVEFVAKNSVFYPNSHSGHIMLMPIRNSSRYDVCSVMEVKDMSDVTKRYIARMNIGSAVETRGSTD